MPAFLESKLKRRYGADSRIPYKIMNSIGAMRGNRETRKGAEMAAKHARDSRSKRSSNRSSHRRSRRSYR